jgi:hypothetical protein
MVAVTVMPSLLSSSLESDVEDADCQDWSSSPEECRNALNRITRSAIFRGAPRLVAFLTFVVEETLAGRAKSIKAYTIAVAALERPNDFDPVADPIVRVEAVRLRAALVRYYATTGAEDPVRIALPLGRYIAQFIRRRVGDGAEVTTNHDDGRGEQHVRTVPIDPSALLDTYRGLVRTALKQETQTLVSAIQNLRHEITTLKSDIARNRSSSIDRPPGRRALSKLALSTQGAA